MTVYRKLKTIKCDFMLSDLRSTKEREFVAEMWDGLQGIGDDIGDEDVREYLTKNQIKWIEDIYEYLCA